MSTKGIYILTIYSLYCLLIVIMIIQTIEKMKKLTESFITKNNDKFSTSPDFFETVEMEMRRLIIKNHWIPFLKHMVPLHNSVDFDIDLNLS